MTREREFEVCPSCGCEGRALRAHPGMYRCVECGVIFYPKEEKKDDEIDK